jgi:hypothetical protein
METLHRAIEQPCLPAGELASNQTLYFLGFNICCSLRGACYFKKATLDLLSRVTTQVVEPWHEINPTKNCFIELRYAVRCQEHHSITIF